MRTAKRDKAQEIKEMQLKTITQYQHINTQSVPQQELPNQPSPQFYYQLWCHMVWDTPVVIWGQLSWAHPLPNSCAPAAAQGWDRKQKQPWLSEGTAQQWIITPY